MWIPDRRTVIVLTSLIGAMTLVSGLLLALEPGPVSLTRQVSLVVMDQDPAGLDPDQKADRSAHRRQARHWLTEARQRKGRQDHLALAGAGDRFLEDVFADAADEVHSVRSRFEEKTIR